MRLPRHPPPIGRPAATAAIALALLAAPAGSASAIPPDVPGRTPVPAAGVAHAQSAISAGKLKRALARKLRQAGGIGGAWVKDLTAGTVLFGKRAKRRLALASNMKLFTTGTAIARLGPEARLDTSAWALGERLK